MRMAMVVVLCGVLWGEAMALGDVELQQRFSSLKQEFMRCVEGSGDVDVLHADLRELVEADPQSPLFLVYLGSSETLIARDAWWPWTKMRYLESGLDKIDRALALLRPEHEQQRVGKAVVGEWVRTTAHQTFLKVPEFSNRSQHAEELAQQLKQYREGGQ